MGIARCITTQLGELLHPPGSLSRVPVLVGRNVTSAGWQVTLCDPIWHMSSHSTEAYLRTAILGPWLGGVVVGASDS